MRSLFKSNNKPFAFQSDELNGSQRLGSNVDAFNCCPLRQPTASAPDPDYDPAPCDIQGKTTWSFTTFTEVERENLDSRVYLGVHWRGDTDVGIMLGVKIGDSIVAQQLATIGF